MLQVHLLRPRREIPYLHVLKHASAKDGHDDSSEMAWWMPGVGEERMGGVEMPESEGRPGCASYDRVLELPSTVKRFSPTTVYDTRAKAPSGQRRRVSYPVSDSMSCRRRARGPVPGAERALRIARTDGLGDRYPGDSH